ncbi:MAG: hypothetical protein JW720_03355 [Sedimentisphaerales bacterium]|nr:hypothetical protein [Sedimentisphaerales bacterium]
MSLVFYMIACLLFLTSVCGYIIVRIRLCPRNDPELDDYYYEVEEQHPAYARYLKWSRITLIGMIVSALMLLMTRVF